MPKQNVSRSKRKQTKRKVSDKRKRLQRERGTAVPLRKLASMNEQQAKEYVRRSRLHDKA